MLADYGDDGVFPCLAPDSEDIYGLPYICFQPLFWEVKQPVPGKPINPYCDFYKLLLRSSDMMDGHKLRHSALSLDVRIHGGRYVHGSSRWKRALS